jgi:hypothetical protein
MRSRLLVLPFAVLLSAILAGCGGGSGTNEPHNTQVFDISSPEFQVEAGQEITYCYYFRATNLATFSVKGWSSSSFPGVSSLAVVFTDTDLGTPGTLTASDCGLAPSGSFAPIPVYLARSSPESFTFPSNDGAGHPVGMTLPANQAGYVRVHVANPTAAAISGNFFLSAEGYEKGSTVTRADPFVAYNGEISIPASGSASVTMDCPFPAAQDVFALTTHTHKQSVHTAINDGPTLLFEGTDWTNPGATTALQPPFLQFATGSLTSSCDYVNPTGSTIPSGDDEAGDEICMAIAWSFPTTEPTYCFGGTIL